MKQNRWLWLSGTSVSIDLNFLVLTPAMPLALLVLFSSQKVLLVPLVIITWLLTRIFRGKYFYLGFEVE